MSNVGALTGQDTATDIMTVESTYDVENNQMEMIAKMAAQELSSHYPRHLWCVGWAPGRTLVIKNMGIEQGKYGYTVDAAKAATISELERAIVMGGGELLERCGVTRGGWDGEFMKLQDTSYKGYP